MHSFTKLLSLHEKHTYMLICYRFQTCCNMKKIYIASLAAVIIYLFLKKSLYFILSTALSWENKRWLFFILIFSNCNALYMYTCFLFSNTAKGPRGVPFLILLRIVLFGAFTSRDSYNCFCRWSWLGWWNFSKIRAAPITFWLVILMKIY